MCDMAAIQISLELSTFLTNALRIFCPENTNELYRIFFILSTFSIESVPFSSKLEWAVK